MSDILSDYMAVVWDRMHLKSKKKKNMDPTTQRLLKQGIVRINTGEKKEGKSSKEKLKKFGKVTYDFWSGVKYVLVLSALLWWLPLFGPILSGYVGGRRSGGPKKGLVAAILALSVIGIIHYGFVENLIPENIMSLIEMPSAALATAYQRPLLAPYVRFIQLYWSSFFTQIMEGLPFSPNSYLLTIVFAYVGGIISESKKREIEAAEGEAGNTINIDLAKIAHSLPYVGHDQRSPSRSESRKARLVQSNYGGWGYRKDSQPKLEDLKAIQYSRKKKSSKNQKSKKRKKNPKQEEDDGRFSPYRRNRVPVKSVRHHSNMEGDDWELL